MRAALLQINSSDSPSGNLPLLLEGIEKAHSGGAGFVLTPELSNCVSTSRKHQNTVLAHEDADETLKSVRDLAKALGIWVSLGSLALKTTDPDGRFANRSFLIGPDGAVVARYDKIHMFDVEIDAEESYRESNGYRPGDKAVMVDTPFAKIGLSICYDLRFGHLYRALAKAGAQILLVPAAFSPATGAAHWEPLLRARAIETGCFVLAAAQCGTHPCHAGASRKTYGHSLAIAPWGEVIADGGAVPGIHYVDLDLHAVDKARRRVPSLSHDRSFTLEA